MRRWDFSPNLPVRNEFPILHDHGHSELYETKVKLLHLVMHTPERIVG
jgi:hypothetical protein